MNLDQAYLRLPHGKNLHCVRKVFRSESGFSCEVVFSSDSPFETSRGFVPVTLMVEAFAQAAALYDPEKPATEGTLSTGFIFKIESFESACSFLTPDVIYMVNLRVSESIQNVLSIEGTFIEQDQVIGEASLLVIQKKAGG